MKNINLPIYLDKLKNYGPFQAKDAEHVGIPQRTLSWLVKKGTVIRIGANAYRHKDIEMLPQEEEFAAACLLMGKDAYIGGLTSLFHYNLLDQAPNQIWLLVPPKINTHNPLYKIIRTKADTSVGVEQKKWYRVSSVPRAILDAFHFQTKMGGLPLAISSARTALREKMTQPKELLELSTKLGWRNNILKHWEAITFE